MFRDVTNRHTHTQTDQHRDSMTESAQWADSVKSASWILITGDVFDVIVTSVLRTILMKIIHERTQKQVSLYMIEFQID